MKIELRRIYNCKQYCIGKLYVDGKWVCDTIEDYDRGLSQEMSLADISRIKVYRQTAIPVGTYKVTMNVQSPKFAQKPYYKTFCDGYLPRILNVPGFDGILIHCGVSADSSAGCLIVGYNTIKGRVTNSRQAWEKLMGILRKAKGGITITISRSYQPPTLNYNPMR